MRVLLFILLSLTSLPSLAAEKPDDPDDNVWHNSIQAGGVINTGNTDTTNFNGKFTSHYHGTPYSGDFTIEGQLGRSNGEKNAQSFLTKANLRRKQSERSYFFAKGTIAYDAFATYDFVVRGALGYGYIPIDDHKQRLALEIGPGSMHQRIAGSNRFQDEVILNTSAYYRYRLSDVAEFKQSLSIDFGPINTHSEAITAIKTKVMKNLALELSFSVNHDSVIPADSVNTKNTDTLSKIAVVYDF